MSARNAVFSGALLPRTAITQNNVLAPIAFRRIILVAGLDITLSVVYHVYHRSRDVIPALRHVEVTQSVIRRAASDVPTGAARHRVAVPYVDRIAGLGIRPANFHAL